MSKKFIAIQDCEFQGKLYRAGEWALFPDDVEIADLFWESEEDYNKKLEEERVVTNTLGSMSDEEKDEKIKELTKELKRAKKATKEKSEEKADDK